MSTVFELVTEDFLEDLEAISTIVSVSNGRGSSRRRTRLAAVHAATLLLSASYEEFVRQMGRSYAQELVRATNNVADLPPKFGSTAWKRTVNDIARKKLNNDGGRKPFEGATREAKQKLETMCAFLDGDMSLDVYDAVIRNEMNMRASELNQIFGVCGITNICAILCGEVELLAYFSETESGKANDKFVKKLDGFIEKRNTIMHALNAGSSSGPRELLDEVEFFKAQALAFPSVLQVRMPQSQQPNAATTKVVEPSWTGPLRWLLEIFKPP